MTDQQIVNLVGAIEMNNHWLQKIAEKLDALIERLETPKPATLAPVGAKEPTP